LIEIFGEGKGKKIIKKGSEKEFFGEKTKKVRKIFKDRFQWKEGKEKREDDY